ncbi:MAG: ribbon-helix-helix protein, CopG family [Deltaproteobacteria bacterium]|nr:ribbon-helix-helix protein, CopG family [Deltaproteobacteria bacterium]
MPTSLHIPKPLIDAVDRRARALQISRNRFIVGAIERELERRSDWSPGFFADLADVEPEDVEAVDEMLAAIRMARTRKAPRRL